MIRVNSWKQRALGITINPSGESGLVQRGCGSPAASSTGWLAARQAVTTDGSAARFGRLFVFQAAGPRGLKPVFYRFPFQIPR